MGIVANSLGDPKRGTDRPFTSFIRRPSSNSEAVWYSGNDSGVVLAEHARECVGVPIMDCAPEAEIRANGLQDYLHSSTKETSTMKSAAIR